MNLISELQMGLTNRGNGLAQGLGVFSIQKSLGKVDQDVRQTLHTLGFPSSGLCISRTLTPQTKERIPSRFHQASPTLSTLGALPLPCQSLPFCIFSSLAQEVLRLWFPPTSLKACLGSSAETIQALVLMGVPWRCSIPSLQPQLLACREPTPV